MKTLYGNAGSGPASKSIQRKTSQIPPYGYIAAIGLVASAEQAYAKQFGVGDVVTSTTINPDDNRDVLLNLSNLDVSGFTPDTTNLYASIIDLSDSTIFFFGFRFVFEQNNFAETTLDQLGETKNGCQRCTQFVGNR